MTDGERIARLERANRRMAWGVGVAVLAALLGAGAGRVARLEADRVETRRLTIVGRDGKVRASLGESEGDVVLTLDGGDGTPRLLLGVDADDNASIHATQPDGRGVSSFCGAGKPAAVEITGPGEKLLVRLPARP